MAHSKPRGGLPLTDTAGDEASQHARKEVHILHAEDGEITCMDNRRQGFRQGLDFTLGIDHLPQCGKEDESLATATQIFHQRFDLTLGYDMCVNVGLTAEFCLEFGMDCPKGLRFITDYQDVLDIGRDIFAFKYTRDLIRVEPIPDPSRDA